MYGMDLAGRRGQVVWRAGTFTTGKGRQLTYDAYVARLSLGVPLLLSDLVHVWDLPLLKGAACKAIPLRPDPAFRRRVLLSNWAGLGALVLLMVAAYVAGRVNLILGALMAVAAVGLGVWAFLASREGTRDTSIRLLLGLHAWGASDPATWDESLVKMVIDPQATFGVESFGALARAAMAQRRWGEAIWAARLCAAVEDKGKGEALTDTILREREVADRLARVRRRPESRDTEFGEALPLEGWLAATPAAHIVEITIG
jgi:hypothetical protein